MSDVSDVPVPETAITAMAKVLIDEWQTVQAEFMTLEDLAAHIGRKGLVAAAPFIAASERETIRQLAVDEFAEYGCECGGCFCYRARPFADLLDGSAVIADAAAQIADLKLRLQAREDELSMHDRVRAGAVERAVAAERERIRLLAIEKHAHYDCDPDYGEPFADLLDGTP